MIIKIEVISGVLRIIQERLEKELPDKLSETETLEQAIEIVKNTWK